MPVDLVSANDASLTSGDEISVTLINKNAMSNMVDVTLQRNSSGATLWFFPALRKPNRKLEPSVRTWFNQVQVDMAKGPREIRQPELRSREILFFWHLDDYLKVKDDLHQMSALMLSCQQDLTMAIDTDAIFQISGSQFPGGARTHSTHGPRPNGGQLPGSFGTRSCHGRNAKRHRRRQHSRGQSHSGAFPAGTLCLPNSATELLEQHFQSQPTMGDLKPAFRDHLAAGSRARRNLRCAEGTRRGKLGTFLFKMDCCLFTVRLGPTALPSVNRGPFTPSSTALTPAVKQVSHCAPAFHGHAAHGRNLRRR